MPAKLGQLNISIRYICQLCSSVCTLLRWRLFASQPKTKRKIIQSSYTNLVLIFKMNRISDQYKCKKFSLFFYQNFINFIFLIYTPIYLFSILGKNFYAWVLKIHLFCVHNSHFLIHLCAFCSHSCFLPAAWPRAFWWRQPRRWDGPPIDFPLAFSSPLILCSLVTVPASFSSCIERWRILPRRSNPLYF